MAPNGSGNAAAAAAGRSPVLAAVCEQLSLSPAQPKGAQQLQPACAEWSPEQWFESFRFLFVPLEDEACGGVAAGLEPHDDLLFFVHAAGVASDGRSAMGQRSQQQQQQQQRLNLDDGMPFSVRRRARQLPGEWCLSGRNFGAVDWRASLLLNVVLQATYQLTTIACSVNLERVGDRVGTGATAPCYPDLCFAVENFDDAFNGLVVSQPSHCYCVLLHALLPNISQPSGTEASAAAGDSGTAASVGAAPRRRLVLFSGYVSHAQIAGFLARNPNLRPSTLLATLLTGRQPAKRQRIVMAGPGGMGQAEVAVQRVAATALPPPGTPAGSGEGGGGGGSGRRGSFISSALSAVTAARKDDSEDDGEWVSVPRPQPGSAPDQPQQRQRQPHEDRLQCALMSMQLPVDKLARSLLEALWQQR